MSTSPRKRPASEAIVAGGVVILLIAIVGIVLAVQGSELYPPAAVTTQAHLISNLYDVVFAIAVAIFVAVEGLIVWSILRYRRKPTDVDLPPQTHGNNLVEVLWTLIPTVIVLYLFAISWDTLTKVDATSYASGSKPDIQIRVLAAQFQWQFEYLDADGNVIVKQTRPLGDGGGMAVPVGKKVYITLRSADVIHAFYVPRFLFKRDVVPGMENHFEFTVDEAEAGNTFHGQCAELCGIGHRAMLFSVTALTQTDFDAWLAALVEKANATPPPLPSGPVLNVTAKTFNFDTKDLQVAAGVNFGIVFKNDDGPAVTHDLDVRDASGKVVENQEPIAGGTSANYAYTPLEAGTYTFFCSIHSNMTGTLTVN